MLSSTTIRNAAGYQEHFDVPLWWHDRYLLPPEDKVVFGYYQSTDSQNHDDVSATVEPQYGRTFDLTICYDSFSLNDSLASTVTVSGGKVMGSALGVINYYLGRRTMVRQDLLFKQYITGSGLPNGEHLWQDIAAGYYDTSSSSYTYHDHNGTLQQNVSGPAYTGITEIMTAIISLPHRIFVSLWHEFDGQNDGGGTLINPSTGVYSSSGTKAWIGTAADFVNAWQHIVTLTRNLVAANPGTYEPVWFFDGAYDNGNGIHAGRMAWGGKVSSSDTIGTMTDTGSIIGGGSNSGNPGTYPGHAYVDIVGWDPYNYGGFHSTNWDTPNDLWNNAQYTGSIGNGTWWGYNFTAGGYSTIAAAQAAGNNSANPPIYKPVMWGETGTGEYFGTAAATSTQPAMIYSSHTTGDDAGTWMTELLALCSSGGAAYGAIRYLTWFGVDYWTRYDATKPLPLTSPPTSVSNVSAYSSSTTYNPYDGVTYYYGSSSNTVTFYRIAGSPAVSNLPPTTGSNYTTLGSGWAVVSLMLAGDTLLQNDSTYCAQRWAQLPALGTANQLKVRLF